MQDVKELLLPYLKPYLIQTEICWFVDDYLGLSKTETFMHCVISRIQSRLTPDWFDWIIGRNWYNWMVECTTEMIQDYPQRPGIIVWRQAWSTVDLLQQLPQFLIFHYQPFLRCKACDQPITSKPRFLLRNEKDVPWINLPIPRCIEITTHSLCLSCHQVCACTDFPFTKRYNKKMISECQLCNKERCMLHDFKENHVICSICVSRFSALAREK
jgi:hypothetical protein